MFTFLHSFKRNKAALVSIILNTEEEGEVVLRRGGVGVEFLDEDAILPPAPLLLAVLAEFDPVIAPAQFTTSPIAINWVESLWSAYNLNCLCLLC